jgi:hypothetical protein
MQTPDPGIPNIPNTPDLGTQLSFGAARPVVLFPVRLETRFFPQANGSSELCVRVYPDKVLIDSHEPELTADELTWGKHFWEQSWRAGTDKEGAEDQGHAKDEERAKAAWRQLAERFDPPRAAWIARVLTPLNPKDRPATPVAPDEPLPKPLRFPSSATKIESWTRAPTTRVLPNQWTVLGYKDGRLVVNVQGGLIPDPLPTGPNPNPSAETDEIGIDEGMRWMVDFEKAEKVGMGIRAALTKEVAAAGLDFLLVMGVRDSLSEMTDWTPQLEGLFNAHHYTDGLSFVAQGTPTNNTQDAPSGFSSKDPAHEESYRAECTGAAFQPGDGSNADALTSAFGLVNAGQVFVNVSNAAAKEQLDARHMNTALWQATWGYFLLQMLGVEATNESPLTDDDINWTRRHFIEYVRASGPLPTVRVGKQPYGVLPVTSLNAWKPQTGQENQYTRDVALRDFLIRLHDLWRRSIPRVPRLGRSEDSGENGIDKDLAEVLSMDAQSSIYSIRHLMGRHYLEHLWVFLSSEFFSDVWQGVTEEPTPEPESPNEEDVPSDLTPSERAAWIHAARLTFIREHGRWRNLMAARRERLALIAAKRASASAWSAIHDERAAALLKTLGVTWTPRLAGAVFAPPVIKLSGALVQGNQSLSFTPNYIESLLAARDLDAIRNGLIQPPQDTLFYLLLRHSMLLEYAAAAARLLIKRNLPAVRREPELVNLPAGQSTQTVWEQIKTKISVGAAEPTIEEYLIGFSPNAEPDVTREPDLTQLSEFRASLVHLKSLNPARLEELMTGTLDLCSHRLDAWITSFATKRLAEMRKTNPTSVLFGGYGWVMNLKPTDGQTKAVSVTGEPDPVFESADDSGFLHTPSLTQAATAALLRSGHLAHGGNQPNGPLGIDLSSQRVRLAEWLLDGVRQGQPLGALLGYRFERRLQEAGLAQFISAFREVAPLVAKKLEQTTEPVESIAANNVVDGLLLQTKWKAQPTLAALFSNLAEQPNADQSQAIALQAELNSLDEAVDAVSDALMAESVYQIVRGNPLRAASTLESIAGGETPPPELEVLRTPRTGIALTHRLVTMFSGAPSLPPNWPSSENSFRAKAEPHVNAWVAKLLGNPTTVRCVVERLEPASGQLLESKEIRLDELGLAPLDFIYAAEGGEGGQQAEIEQRILYTFMRKPDGFMAGSLLRVNPSRKPEWNVSELSYGEFNEVLRTARKLIAGVRAIHADDLNLPERSATFSVDVDDLEQRAAGSQESLLQTNEDLRRHLAASGTASLDVLREVIMRSGGFGVAGAIPLSATGDSPADRQTLLTQALSIQKELAQRELQLVELAKDFNANKATLAEKRDYAFARLHIVFGKAFVVLPRFAAANADELEKALTDSPKVQDGDPFASTTWFQRMARVRDGVARLNDTLNYAEALKTGEKLELTIAQLPYEGNDRWVGLPLKVEQHLQGGKLSIAVLSSAPLDVRQPLAGLLIDEWVEVVPSAKETTGIAFAYDQPNAAPPQTILIAVPPEIESPWTVWSLQQVLLETLDLARIRAVDPDALDEVGHYLPALYFAYNTAGDTVSTDFTTIK